MFATEVRLLLLMLMSVLSMWCKGFLFFFFFFFFFLFLSVEKMAAVFSLKLDQGHKSLCPWIDNVCDEMLAQFPPTPPPVLIDKFKERCSALLQLSALPIISSSAFEYVRSPQLEQILEQSLVLQFENGSADISRAEYLSDENHVDSEKYYQVPRMFASELSKPNVILYNTKQ